MGLGSDDRGQAMQVGFILLFAVLLIIFSLYQAVIVPNQNAAVEFNHNQRVQGDMLDLRNAILTTKSTGEDGFARIELGTRFPARLVAINPAPPSGSLQTTEARQIVVEQGGTDITDDVCPATPVESRAVEYTPDYSAYGHDATLRYENSLLYHDFDDAEVLLSNQQLVRGDTVQLIPVTNSLGESGTRTVAIDTKAGVLDTSTRSDITVTVPTQLSEAKWEEALAGEVDPANVTVSGTGTSQNLTLTLGGAYQISCGPVGMGDTPPSGPRGTGDAGGINPAGPDDITLEDENRNGNNVSMTFNNSAGTVNITEARLNFYSAQSGNTPSEGDIQLPDGSSQTLQIGGPWETLDPEIELRGDDTETQVNVVFDGTVSPNDWFVISLEFEDGKTELYFVSLRDA